jgi:hypothetical protein
VPQDQLPDDILKTMYFFSKQFFCELIDRIPNNFYSRHIWNKVIGENYYLPSILEFFKSAGFQDMYLEEEMLSPEVQLRYFAPWFVARLSERISSMLISPKEVQARDS